MSMRKDGVTVGDLRHQTSRCGNYPVVIVCETEGIPPLKVMEVYAETDGTFKIVVAAKPEKETGSQ